MNSLRRGAWAFLAILLASPALAGVLPNCASVCGADDSVTTDRIADLAVTPAKVSEWAPVYIQLCGPGTSALNLCATMTAQGAGPDPVGANAFVEWDTTNYHSFRLYVQMGNVAATTMDLELECDTTQAFSTPTTMVQITQASLTSANLGSSAWTDFSANECFGADKFFRVVAVGGNGIESPSIRKMYLALK